MKKAFTLIELLTVIAISAVMLTLIVLPVFQSFNVLRTAQAFSDAQDKGRLLVDMIQREVGNAVSVRNIGSTTAVLPDVDASGKPTGGTHSVDLPYTKMDLVLPAEGDPGNKIGGAYVDPSTGKGDPTLQHPKGDKRLPVAPGMVTTRWWVGLNRAATEPTDGSTPLPVPYNEPYTGILMERSATRDNLYVLRRAQVQPFIYRNRKDRPNDDTTKAWRPNLKFFKSDDQVSSGVEFDRQIVDLDDPKFFVADGLDQTPPDPDKNVRVLNWQKASIVETEVSRYDMIRPVVKGSPPQPVRDGGNQPLIVPLVQFRPTRVSAAPATGSAAARPGEGADGLEKIGPDSYKTERGLWANAIVRYYPEGHQPGITPFEIASVDLLGGVTISAGGVGTGGLDGILDAPDNFALFSLQRYEQLQARGGLYPFTVAALGADQDDLNSNPQPPGRLWTPEESMRRTFMPFRVLTGTGKIVTSFPIEEVGVNPISGNRPNLPLLYSINGLSPTLAAKDDANLRNAPLSPISTLVSNSNPFDVNRAFNRLAVTYPDLQNTLQRFIDLRFVANEDGTFSPLCPLAQSGKVQGFSFNNPNGGAFNRVRIVPGSDEVYGPDQNPGPNYGNTVRYTRTTSANPGPNQYRMVYADLAEPTNASGGVDYGALGLELPAAELSAFNPQVYDPENVVSAAIQPRYKAGYLQLCSDPNVPIPARAAPDGTPIPLPITVRYRFAFNGPGDTFAVDHDTREVLQILLTVKNYPQANVPNAQTITLKSTATLRNALR